MESTETAVGRQSYLRCKQETVKSAAARPVGSGRAHFRGAFKDAFMTIVLAG
jgi:hypothetical protein